MVNKYRDITFIKIDNNNYISVACDSAGGIGNKENDIIKVDPFVTGYYTAFVALAETIAVGAMPITLINTLSVEMNDTGNKIIRGIHKALDQIGLSEEALITGSTEENIPVTVTGLGITVLGRVNTNIWNLPKAKERDILVAVGIPKVGDEVVNDNGEILTLSQLLRIKQCKYVNDVLPVGSKGIRYEALEMARTGELSFNEFDNIDLDMKKSGGPATCAVVAIDERYIDELKSVLSIPITVIGKIMK
ncbi:MAG: AIR synthase related protein [Vallitalea sp.]|jgi:selenophosphate synthetase-related protein|nr:AIR synthase related protein [Vallitalea sp.]